MMLQYSGRRFKLYPYKAKFTDRHGNQKQKWALPSKEWWTSSASRQGFEVEFEEQTLTGEQQERYEQVRRIDMPEQFRGICMDYILEGGFPEGFIHSLRDIEIAEEHKAMRKVGQVSTKKLILMDELTADEMNDLLDIYDGWNVGETYKVGDVVTYHGAFYEALQEHTSQADWTPDTVPALFKSHAPAGVIPEWVQPTGAHDAYNVGDKVTYNGVVYESVIDANTWSPAVHGWEEV